MSWTIQKLIDDEMTVAAFCETPGCGHNAKLDLEVLKERLGGDAPAMASDLKPELYCKVCLGKAIGLTYTPSGNERMVPVNRYAKASR